MNAKAGQLLMSNFIQTYVLMIVDISLYAE